MVETKFIVGLVIWVLFWQGFTQYVYEPLAEFDGPPSTNAIENVPADVLAAGDVQLDSPTEVDLTNPLRGVRGILAFFAGFSLSAALNTPTWILFLFSANNIASTIAIMWMVIRLLRGV